MDDFRQLQHRFFLGELSDEEMEALELALEEDESLRKRHIQLAMLDTGLNELSAYSEEEKEKPRRKAMARNHYLKYAMAVAACLLLSFSLYYFQSNQKGIAILVKSDSAVWEDELGMYPGAHLSPGDLKLSAGIATLQFNSGVHLLMRGPSFVTLNNGMNIEVSRGFVRVDIPKGAKGFRLETPFGYAIDHGTAFSVHVDPMKQESHFGVNEGKISVHHHSGEFLYLVDQQSTAISTSGIGKVRGIINETGQFGYNNANVLSSEGMEVSIVANDERRSRLDARYLMVKHQEQNKALDRKSYFSFNLEGVDFSQVRQAELQLNAVPTRLGSSENMPRYSTFSLYVINESQETRFKKDLKWDEAPAESMAQMIASFDLAQNELQKNISIKNSALLDVLQQDSSGLITFLLVCDTSGGSLVHGFASSAHPTFIGPQLILHGEGE
ncbi:MAG: FecR domain-containing protein [Planctomycetes bacterium]|nr:FecR domain-containing protein [Planctomycetota bacterium]